MSLTKKDLQQIVKVLTPKFNAIDKRFEQVDKHFEQVDKRFEQIDKRFEQVDKHFVQVDKHFEQINKRFKEVDRQFVQVDDSFKTLRIEIGSMITPLATREELHSLEKRLEKTNDRLDEFIEDYNQFCGNTADFQSKVIQRFGHIDEKLEGHDSLFQQVFDYVKPISTMVKDREHRLKKLEETA